MLDIHHSNRVSLRDCERVLRDVSELVVRPSNPDQKVDVTPDDTVNWDKHLKDHWNFIDEKHKKIGHFRRDRVNVVGKSKVGPGQVPKSASFLFKTNDKGRQRWPPILFPRWERQSPQSQAYLCSRHGSPRMW